MTLWRQLLKLLFLLQWSQLFLLICLVTTVSDAVTGFSTADVEVATTTAVIAAVLAAIRTTVLHKKNEHRAVIATVPIVVHYIDNESELFYLSLVESANFVKAK